MFLQVHSLLELKKLTTEYPVEERIDYGDEQFIFYAGSLEAYENDPKVQ